jgi:hypothetical protein
MQLKIIWKYVMLKDSSYSYCYYKYQVNHMLNFYALGDIQPITFIIIYTNVACVVGQSVNMFQNRGNSTYENYFVRLRI